MSDAETCRFDGCPEDATEGKGGWDGYCDGHRQQKARGQELTALRDYGRTPLQVLVDAAIDLGNSDAEDDGAYARQRKYLSVAALRYALSTPKGQKMLAAMKLQSECVKCPKGARS
jgi:hypothetical protein